MPGINDTAPNPRSYPRNPGFNNHDLSLFKNFPIGASGKRSLQLRIEAFNVLNHTQFSGVNRTTNVTPASGATGAAVFNDFNNLRMTNNNRPQGSTAPLGQFFGEYEAIVVQAVSPERARLRAGVDHLASHLRRTRRG